jgi:hypothetical protein
MRIRLANDWDYPPNPYPTETQNKGHFVGRHAEVTLLANDFIRKDSGSILLSGVRGVGKTSLVYAAMREVESVSVSDGRVLLPVILNASQLQPRIKDEATLQPTVIEALIRRLYSAVHQHRRHDVGDVGFLGNDLKNLYRKAVASDVKLVAEREASSSEGFIAENEESRTVSLAPDLRLLIGSGVAVVSGFFAAFSWGDQSLPVLIGSSLVTLLGVVGVTFSFVKKVTVKKSDSEKRDTKASEYYMMDNDIGNLEADLEDVLATLRPRFRVLFIVDELDKIIHEHDVDYALSMVRGFKNLFTLSPALFVFITSDEVFEQIENSRSNRGVDGTLFTHRFFIKRPEHGDLEKFVHEVGTLEDQKDAPEFEQFIDYACYASRSDFTFLYEVLRDHVTRFDSEHRPIIEIEQLSSSEKNQANAQKALKQVYDRYRYQRPSGWCKNDVLLKSLYAALEEFIGAPVGTDVLEPVASSGEAEATIDLLKAFERHGGLTHAGTANPLAEDSSVTVNRYSWDGRIDAIPDSLDVLTTLESSVLAAAERMDELVNELARVGIGVESGAARTQGREVPERYAWLAHAAGLDLRAANDEVQPTVGALRAKPMRHRTREQLDFALATFQASREEVLKLVHRALAMSTVTPEVQVSTLEETRSEAWDEACQLILASEVANVVLFRTQEPRRAAVFLDEAPQSLLDALTEKLGAHSIGLRIVDVRASSDPASVGAKATRRGVYSVSMRKTGLLIRRLRAIRSWLADAQATGAAVPFEIDGDRYLSSVEAARYANVSVRTIRRWFDRGLVVGLRTPTGRLLIAEASLDGHLKGGG